MESRGWKDIRIVIMLYAAKGAMKIYLLDRYLSNPLLQLPK